MSLALLVLLLAAGCAPRHFASSSDARQVFRRVSLPVGMVETSLPEDGGVLSNQRSGLYAELHLRGEKYLEERRLKGEGFYRSRKTGCYEARLRLVSRDWLMPEGLSVMGRRRHESLIAQRRRRDEESPPPEEDHALIELCPAPEGAYTLKALLWPELMLGKAGLVWSLRRDAALGAAHLEFTGKLFTWTRSPVTRAFHYREDLAVKGAVSAKMRRERKRFRDPAWWKDAGWGLDAQEWRKR